MSRKVNLTDMEKAIYSMAFQDIQLKKKYISPLRPDKDASFEFFINKKSKRLWWHDWGTGEKGNCYDFLDRYDGEMKSRPITVREAKEIAKEREIKTREFIAEELRFWLDFGITRSTLKKFNVEAIESIDGTVKTMMFLYKIKSGRFKVYNPLAKVKKWRFWGTMNASDFFGLDQLEPNKEEDVFITKSLKDVMTLSEMGIQAISPNAESITISKKLIAYLKENFRHVYILYDNDEAGMKYSGKAAQEHDLINITLNIAKDISDCVKIHGMKKAISHLKTLIKRTWIG